MKILIIDDAAKNLEAAKKASKQKQFSKHKFIFTNKATDAMKMIKKNVVDAVITGFLFQYEPFFNQKSYDEYISAYDENAPKVAGETYKSNISRMMYDRHLLTRLENSNAYGGVIAIMCKKLGVPFTIITEVKHDHESYSPKVALNIAARVDGVFVLSPLIGAGILTINDICNDNHEKYYQGNSYKRSFKCWEKGIKMILNQPIKNVLQDRIRIVRKAQDIMQKTIDAEKQAQIKNFMKKFAKKTYGIYLHDGLRHQILPYIDENSLTVVGSRIAVMISDVIGNKSCVTVFCDNQRSDCLQCKKVSCLGTIKVSETVKGVVYVDVELIDYSGNAEIVTFKFEEL